MSSTIYLKVLTPPCRLSHPSLITPKKYKEKGVEKGDPFYSAELIAPKDGPLFHFVHPETEKLTPMDAWSIYTKLAIKAWPDLTDEAELNSAIKFGGLKLSLTDGDKKAKDEAAKWRAKFPEKEERDFSHYENSWVISTKSMEEKPPTLRYTENGVLKTIERTVDSQKPKANMMFHNGGAYITAEITLGAVKTPQGRYVTSYLNGVRYLRPGPSLGGGSFNSADLVGAKFDELYGDAVEHDPTKGMDEEIPF